MRRDRLHRKKPSPSPSLRRAGRSSPILRSGSSRAGGNDSAATEDGSDGRGENLRQSAGLVVNPMVSSYRRARTSRSLPATVEIWSAAGDSLTLWAGNENDSHNHSCGYTKIRSWTTTTKSFFPSPVTSTIRASRGSGCSLRRLRKVRSSNTCQRVAGMSLLFLSKMTTSR